MSMVTFIQEKILSSNHSIGMAVSHGLDGKKTKLNATATATATATAYKASDRHNQYLLMIQALQGKLAQYLYTRKGN